MARHPFWMFDPLETVDAEQEREKWRKRLRRFRRMNTLPRAVASARRLVRAEYFLDAERLQSRMTSRGQHFPQALTTRRTTRRREPRQIVIVTTAAPPWLTGTSVNPLCRAVSLAERGLSVAILFPWLEAENQAELFAKGLLFASRAEQERWIRAHFACEGIEILFYRARYHPGIRSILPTRSVASFVPPSNLLILEEPEHLLAPHPWQKLRDKAGYVVGIVHTHYLYLMTMYLGEQVMNVAEPPLRVAIPRVVRRNCQKTICLSRTITGYEGAVFENVNGVRDEFFRQELGADTAQATSGAYFIGKLIWEKGFRELIDNLARTDIRSIDVFGSGDNRDEILGYAEANGVTLNMRGLSVKPYEDLASYRAFVNTSTSEVLCTTTAEALAMGKWVIIPRHVSNEFFFRFPNCLTYTTPEEFADALHRALREEPTPGDRQALSWDAATERLLRQIGR